MQFSDNKSTSKLAPQGTLQTVQGKQIVAKSLGIIEGLVGAGQAKEAAEAAQAAKDAASLGNFGTQPGLGGQGGLDITGKQQHHDSSKYSIPMPGMPTGRDLLGQDDSPTATHTTNGSDDRGQTRGSVWMERSTERSSSDGNRTWGSATYRDWSGNFWRSDYTIERGSDGGTTSKDTVFDSHNEPIKTTVIYTAIDGSEKVTTTDHQTGQTTTTQGTVKPEAPAPEEGEGKPGKDKNQGETSGYVAAYTPKVFKSPNKVNPGPDGGDASGQSVEPVRLDPGILVTDPAPDQMVGGGMGTPKDIRHENVNVNTIDPPRPQAG
ncbi:MAG TPA: hypothetical protein VLH86_02800 [Patescibacteria group bacterium]|nr:hypothetical protein [Patescibacteria group bacterium]